MKLGYRLIAILFMFAVVPLLADPIILDFEGITYGISNVHTTTGILDFYAGGAQYTAQGPIGFGSLPNEPGPNYGITFPTSALAVCLNDQPFTRCSNISRGGLGDPSSQLSALYISSGFVNVIGGFRDRLSLFYNGTEPNVVNIFSGLDGTGTFLGELRLAPTTSSDCPAFQYAAVCPFYPAGATFPGVGHSLQFTSSGYFDDLTFGNSSPDLPEVRPVPEPPTFLLISSAIATASVGHLVRTVRGRAASRYNAATASFIRNNLAADGPFQKEQLTRTRRENRSLSCRTIGSGWHSVDNSLLSGLNR